MHIILSYRQGQGASDGVSYHACAGCCVAGVAGACVVCVTNHALSPQFLPATRNQT